MFSFASKRTLLPEAFNPVHGIEKYPERGRERFLSIEELERLGVAIREAESEGVCHSFASFGAGSGMGLPIVGKLLGHANAMTTSRYAHLDADPIRRASERIGTTIAAAMGEGATLDNAKIIKLRS